MACSAFALVACSAQAAELAPNLGHTEFRESAKLASIIWEGGSEDAGSFDLSEPPAGPPHWDAGPTVEETKPVKSPVSVGLPPQKMGPILSAPVKIPAKEGESTEAGGSELPSPDKVAAELGYKTPELKKFVVDFAASISQGPRSMAYRRLCTRDEDSCRLLADFHAQAVDAKRERRRVRRKVKNFRITEENVAQAQRFNFHVLANNLRIASPERLQLLASKSLKETDCPRNLSAALAIKSEEYFPEQKARTLARELFDHARPCLALDDEIYERLFLRFGLLAYYDGDKARAKQLLLEAKKATSPTERYRMLYWLGRLAFESEEGKGKENADWSELMNQYPLSFYAIEAAVSLGRDPLEMITQRKIGGLKRDAPNDPELNRMIRWLEALYVFKQQGAVAKWASWIVRANEGELDVDVLLYLSSLKVASGLYRSNISMLFNFFRKNPAALNKEGLKLLYPRPYFSMIQEASKGRIDPFLVLGLVRQESGFDPRAISHAKAKGLMQIIPGTARRLASQGHKKLLDEKENTKMGVKYLLQLAEGFDGKAELVLAAYNAGPHRVVEWLRRNPDRKTNPLLWNDLIPYMETRDYVVSILRNNYLYLRLYGSQESDAGHLFSSELLKELLAKSAGH